MNDTIYLVRDLEGEIIGACSSEDFIEKMLEEFEIPEYISKDFTIDIIKIYM